MTSPLTMHITLAGPSPFLVTIHAPFLTRYPPPASKEPWPTFLASESRGAQLLIRHSCLWWSIRCHFHFTGQSSPSRPNSKTFEGPKCKGAD